MYALNHAAIFAHIHCGNYKAAKAELEELVALANEKGAPFWKALATINKGLLLALDGNEFDAIKTFTSGMAAYQSTGATLYRPQHLSYLASAHAKVGQFEEAWRCISEAITAVETTKESWYEAEVNRVAGEVALKMPEPDAAKAEAYFERALAVARQQQAKSWEVRAAMSMARLWRDQGKRAASARTARSGLRLVHGRLRHARSEGGEGAAGRAARLTTNFETASKVIAGARGFSVSAVAHRPCSASL